MLGNFPNNRIDARVLLDVVTAVEAPINKIAPGRTFIHYAGYVKVAYSDPYEAMIAASRHLLGPSLCKQLSWEVASNTVWQAPNSAQVFAPYWFADISDGLGWKLAPHDASARKSRLLQEDEHLVRWRGIEAAETLIWGHCQS